jgi:hypothetical protein
MKNSLLLILFLSVFFQACTGNYGHSGSVQTDNGKRWIANPETTAGIANMQTILSKYEGKTLEPKTQAKYKNELENEFQNIFKQCTMKGEAHNQLHNFLLPMKAMFESIESENPEEAEEAANELKQHLSTYKNYFE